MLRFRQCMKCCYNDRSFAFQRALASTSSADVLDCKIVVVGGGTAGCAAAAALSRKLPQQASTQCVYVMLNQLCCIDPKLEKSMSR